MVFNFSSLRSGGESESTRPGDLYAALPTDKPRRLRAEQARVLDEWYDQRRSSDLIVKQNTGSGKTLTGLLIAYSSMKELGKPVIYLVPDKFLIRQVENEANAAAIPSVTDFHSLEFRSSKAVLVTTFHKLVNGRSAFGVEGKQDWIELGAVVIDDAHSALTLSERIFGPIISAESSLWEELLDLFKEDLLKQSPKTFNDIDTGDRSTPMRVSPIFISKNADKIRQIIQPHVTDEHPDLYFSWPFISDILNICSFTVTDRYLQIKSPCPRVSFIPSLSEATRKIYLSATLQDEGMLVTELGADPEGVLNTIKPDRASDLGDRMILAPMAINPRLRFDDVKNAVVKLAKDSSATTDGQAAEATKIRNAVILVPSHEAAKRWVDVADETLTVDNMGPVIDRLKNGDLVGIVVLVNKYDGVDLPDGACRLLVIDGLPVPTTPAKMRAAAAMRGSSEYEALNVHKLEQGMGRGVRDISDYCAVLITQPDTALLVQSESARRHFSPGTRAQIELSQRLASGIDNFDLDSIVGIVERFLARESEWISVSKEAIAKAVYPDVGSVSSQAVARRDAFDLALRDDFVGAAGKIQDMTVSVDDDRVRGWYLEELATYQSAYDVSLAERTLVKARKLNSVVVKPTTFAASIPRQTTIALPQFEQSARYISSSFADRSEFELKVQSIFSHFVWSRRGTHEDFEGSFCELGSILGFDSSRPDSDAGDGGPDIVWRIPGECAFVVEVKNEVRRDDEMISKSEVAQLTHSINWYNDVYRDRQAVIPVLIHPFNTLNSNAVAPDNMQLVHKKVIGSLRERVTRFVTAIVSSDNWIDSSVIGEALIENHLHGENVLRGGNVKKSRK